MNNMHLSKELQDVAVDPMQFDALLSVFQRSDSFEPILSAKRPANQIAERLLSEIDQSAQDNTLFSSLKSSIENYPQPCILVSEAGQIVALNKPAYSAFDIEISDQINNCGVETQDSMSISDKIRDVINDSSNNNEMSFCGAYYTDAGRPVTLAIAPNSNSKSPVKAALVFLIDIDWNGAIGTFLSNSYDLTHSEQAVLEMFILGDSLEQIAKKRCRSFKTVRTQFYSALAKCGLSSQVDLVREVVAGSLFNNLMPHIAQPKKHPHRKELTILRPDGRTLEVIMTGDFTGTPIMLLSSVGVQKFNASQEHKLFKAAVCLYTISPPGYGKTSPPQKIQDRIICLSEDVKSLLDQLSLPNAAFVSFATSFLPTLRLAQKLPNRISRIISLSTIPPSPYHKEFEQQKPASVVRAIAKSMLVSSTMKNLLTRSAIRAWAILGTRKMSKIHSKSEPELTPFLLEPDCIEAIDESFKAATSQGFSQVIRDCEETHSDWRPELDACDVPTLVVHGRNNNTTDISIVRDFVTDYPEKLQLLEIDDAGSFLHITHEDEYVEMLRDFSRGTSLFETKSRLAIPA